MKLHFQITATTALDLPLAHPCVGSAHGLTAAFQNSIAVQNSLCPQKAKKPHQSPP